MSICSLLAFFTFQKKVKNSTYKKYYLYSIIPILIYSITYGFRKGWGTDYETYNALFSGDFRLDIDSYEILFRTIVISLQNISDSSSTLFILTAALTIFSYIYILKDNRNILGLGLSLFYLFSAYQASNLVRFFMAMAIAYIGIDLTLRKKWIYATIALASSVLIHTGILLFILGSLPLVRFKLFLNLKYNVILYLFSTIVSIESIQTLFGEMVYRMLSSLDFGNLQLVKYADKDIVNNYILGTTWGNVEKSIFYIIFNWLFGFLFILLGYKLITKIPNIKNIKYYYQIGSLGVILCNLFANTEILYRISISFIYLSSMVYAYIIKYNRKLKIPPLLFMLFLLSVIYMCVFSLKQIYNYFDVLYIWD